MFENLNIFADPKRIVFWISTVPTNIYSSPIHWSRCLMTPSRYPTTTGTIWRILKLSQSFYFSFQTFILFYFFVLSLVDLFISWNRYITCTKAPFCFVYNNIFGFSSFNNMFKRYTDASNCLDLSTFYTHARECWYHFPLLAIYFSHNFQSV